MTPRRRRARFIERNWVLLIVGGGFVACFLFIALGREFGWF